MGTLYRDVSNTINNESQLFNNLPEGLSEYKEENPHSLWKRAVTDGNNYLWIETHNGCITHFLRWGVNDARHIIKQLNRQFGAVIVSEYDDRFYQI